LFFLSLLFSGAVLFAERTAVQSRIQPNIILLLADNLGYGDVGSFGSQLHRTPNIDRLAEEGIRLTSFYVSSGVCTPSRASLMTGSYPRRVNMHMDVRETAVIRPVSPIGLNPSEITVAEVLKGLGYVTALIGKWHLGDQAPFLPTRQGFDYYYGIPYSDDMTERDEPPWDRYPWPPLPLMRNEQVIEAPADRDILTRRYTEEAIRFIEENRGRPFFLFLSHAMPGSTPHPFASDPFKGKSKNGPYGDSVEEIDWSTGEILQTLERLGLEDNTLIIFTSDNGAPRRDPPQGSNKPLAGWGYTVAEGGMRVPFLARWPGQIPPGVTSDYLATSMDLLPTFAELAGGSGPQDRMIDGKNIWSILTNEATGSPHEAFYYYYMDQLRAVRSGKWKLYLQLDQEDVVGQEVDASQPRLFDLSTDLTESRDVAAENRAVVDRLIRLAERARDDLGDRGRHGKNQRPAGWVAQPLPQVRK